MVILDYGPFRWKNRVQKFQAAGGSREQLESAVEDAGGTCLGKKRLEVHKSCNCAAGGQEEGGARQ